MKGKWSSSQQRRERQREAGFVAGPPRFASRNTWTERGRCYVLLAAARRLAREFRALGLSLAALALTSEDFTWAEMFLKDTELLWYPISFFFHFINLFLFFFFWENSYSAPIHRRKWLSFLRTFPQPETTPAHAHLQAASNKLGITSAESSWLQFSDFSSLTAKSCLVRMELCDFHNQFFRMHHEQPIEYFTTMIQNLQLKTVREIPPKPLAWTLGVSPQQKYRLQQLQTPENYNFYFCSVLWAPASFNSWKFT